MATFWKKVFISAAAALFTGGSTGLKAAEGAGPSGAGAGAGTGAVAGGSAGSISMVTAVSVGVTGLGFMAVAADGDSGGTTRDWDLWLWPLTVIVEAQHLSLRRCIRRGRP